MKRKNKIVVFLYLISLTHLSMANTNMVKVSTASNASFYKNKIKVQVGYEATTRNVYAGGPIDATLTIKNMGENTVYVAAGMTGVRPAYMLFQAKLFKYDETLQDPLQTDPLQLQGLNTAVMIKPGQLYKRTIVLNQFLALEHLLTIIEEGQSGFLNVGWKYFLTIGLSFEDAVSQVNNLPILEGTFVIKVNRDDAALKLDVQKITNLISQDWNVMAASPVDRLHNITKLTSLRILTVKPYLISIADHPDPNIRRAVQHALDELKSK